MVNLLAAAAVLLLTPCTDTLRAHLPDLARAAGGKTGVAITLVETGDSIATLNEDDHFPMQSVYKLPIAMAALALVDQKTLSLDQRVKVETNDFVSAGQYSPLRDAHPEGVTLTLRELLRLTVSESDGTASDVVMRLAGGAAKVDAYLRALGLDEIKVRDTEQAIGRSHAVQYRNWATPRAAAALLVALQRGTTLSPSSRALLMQDLTQGTRGNQRIPGLLPASAIVAHKPGTSGTDRNGVTAATNDIGLVTLPDGRHLAVAVFITDSKADDPTRDTAIARIAAAAWECQVR